MYELIDVYFISLYCLIHIIISKLLSTVSATVL